MNERIEQATREYVDNLVNSRDGSSYSIHQKRLAARFDAYDLEECVCNIVEVLLSHQWISVEEELPPVDEEEENTSINVLAKTKHCMRYAYYDFYNRVWRSVEGGDEFRDDVTHWMLIPPLEGGEEFSE